jgi:hypothetical protein
MANGSLTCSGPGQLKCALQGPSATSAVTGSVAEPGIGQQPGHAAEPRLPVDGLLHGVQDAPGRLMIPEGQPGVGERGSGVRIRTPGRHDAPPPPRPGCRR